jgi:hypothetical protein
MFKELVYATHDSTQWRSVLPARDNVFASVEFAQITERYLDRKAQLYILKNGDTQIAYPFFFRPVHSLPVGEDFRGGLSDTVSPEFTGPLSQGGPVTSIAVEFPKRFSAFAVNQGVVAEFIHLHPWKALSGALLPDGLQFSREIVYVDLTWPEHRLWPSFSHACRKNIMRSQRENVRVFEAQTLGDIREFYRVYIQTMKYRNALGHYYYSLDYFSSIFEELRANARFVLAEYRNQIVAGTLYLHDRDDVYSYLGGADHNFQHVRPTNAIIYETIFWSKRQGRKRLILGGGYSPNDGIFRFKASFSPERVRFFVYKRVHLHEEYAALCRSWASTHGRNSESTGYFPPYRFLPAPESARDSAETAFVVAD